MAVGSEAMLLTRARILAPALTHPDPRHNPLVRALPRPSSRPNPLIRARTHAPPWWVQPRMRRRTTPGGAAMATCCEIMPPMEMPMRLNVVKPTCAARPRVSRANCSIVYGPSGMSLSPIPRLSNISTGRVAASRSASPCQSSFTPDLPRPRRRHTGRDDTNDTRGTGRAQGRGSASSRPNTKPLWLLLKKRS